MKKSCTCQCDCEDTEPRLVFPCSGAADGGEVADRAARWMTRAGTGDMYCLAGIGGRVSGIMASTQAATKILAIDGCPQECARKTLEQAGFTGFRHLKLTDLGLLKRQTPPTDDVVRRVAEAGAVSLNT
jgi:uncharacterized metal-binding protein